jgi:6-phosphogluconolactonase
MKTGNNFELVQFGSPAELALSVAAEWLKDVAASCAAGATYPVALSGGRIARRFFSAVADLAKSDPAGLNSVHFFWGDERCVPPNDPESNYGLAYDVMLKPLGISGSRIHRLRGEDPPALAASRAEAEMRQFVPTGTGGAQPLLNLVFLGMGEDGHVASLFPGESEQFMTSQAVFRPVIAAKPPPHRVTIGYPAINAALRVWVLASGAGKEDALRKSLLPQSPTPLARVLTLREHTKIFTDLRLN